VGDGGRGSERQLWQYGHRSMMPNSAGNPWPYCHDAAEAPAPHPRLELSTTVDAIPEIPEESVRSHRNSLSARSTLTLVIRYLTRGRRSRPPLPSEHEQWSPATPRSRQTISLRHAG
jgi:hypothetical protein